MRVSSAKSPLSFFKGWLKGAALQGAGEQGMTLLWALPVAGSGEGTPGLADAVSFPAPRLPFFPLLTTPLFLGGPRDLVPPRPHAPRVHPESVFANVKLVASVPSWHLRFWMGPESSSGQARPFSDSLF